MPQRRSAPEAAWASPEMEIVAAASLIQVTNHVRGIQALARPQPNISQGRRRSSPCSSVRGAKLVVTSSPYPGLYALYHGRQVAGRKEAPLPFVIANKLDAHWIGTIAPYT
jgi:hypothetical protein